MRREVTFEVNENGCFICTLHGINKDGYPVMKENGKTCLIHRKVYEEKNGKIPDGLVIRHTCDNRRCINPEHLLIGEHKDNVADRVLRNRSARGEKNGRAKLKETDVVFIRNSDQSNGVLAKKFSVDRALIRKIRQRMIWKHIA
jgi:hypothetical protein